MSNCILPGSTTHCQSIARHQWVCSAPAKLSSLLALLLLLLFQAMLYAGKAGVWHAVLTRGPGQLQLQPVQGQAA
jgi:hypothetical protein